MKPDACPPDERDEIDLPEAARVLGVSRLHVARLIEAGLLPHQGTGSDPRIQRSDLHAYKEELDRRHALLDELTAEAQEMGLY
ncbi:MAG TPA: helix-turn-helix domain-containing protein [Longimicrobium sp.]|nr:helix-turn-helix domain-containing protein [Longimicrobium sp.]